MPDAHELPTALIDVRDLATWLVESAGAGHSGAERNGVMNAMGRPLALPDHLELVRSLAEHQGGVAPAPEAWLAEQGVSEWSGPRSLPLWLADPDWYGLNARSTDRALAAGLALRPLEQTVRDILTEQTEQPAGAGLSDDDERELLTDLDGLAR